MNFPRNIFQTWKTENVPEQWKEGQQSVIQKNPNWKYTLLTDSDNDSIVKEYFPDFYQTFKSFKYPIQKADAVRYCVLYLYGGIYLDLDYICNKSFDDIKLTKEVGLIHSSTTNYSFTNSFLVSQPKSQFWLKCIEEMKKPLPFYKSLTKHFEIMNSTGPGLITLVADKNKNYVEELINIQTNCGICEVNKNLCVVDNKYIKPIKGSSWHSWDSQLFNFLLCNKNLIILIILIVLILKIFVKSKKR